MNDHRCSQYCAVTAVFPTHRIEVCQKCGDEFWCYYDPHYVPVDVEKEIKRLKNVGRTLAIGGTISSIEKPEKMINFHSHLHSLTDNDAISAEHPEPYRKVKKDDGS